MKWMLLLMPFQHIFHQLLASSLSYSMLLRHKSVFCATCTNIFRLLILSHYCSPAYGIFIFGQNNYTKEVNYSSDPKTEIHPRPHRSW